jgi:glycosyltransferase involved in cell wall biosynthesis
VPVLAANSSSLPEVCGGAALLVDPRDVEAIGAGIARLHRDSVLRADLHVRGLARAAAFPPDAVGRAWRALHEEIAG